jgi:hypothetical protein
LTLNTLKRIFFPVALCVTLPVSAQFYTQGADPGSIRWNSVETPTYRVIYPRGLDSLARAYAITLEQVASGVGAGVGFRPNEAYRSKMPVVLHAYTARSNGQVTWTPHRMELLTVPDAFSFDPTPWALQLAVHESRHVAQMQPGASKPFRWLRVMGGELAAGGLSAVYGGPAFLEGDAVVAETALTHAGRGRTAEFLEYYRVSFAAGDFRDYWRWRYGSQRWYTPDHYRAGYLAIGGIRALYGVPDLTERFYRRIADHGGVAFLNWNKTVREATGKPFKEAFAEVCENLQAQWVADEFARGPFIPAETVSTLPRRFTEFRDLEAVGDRLFAVRSGITRPARLVRIGADGQEEPFTLLGTGLSHPRYAVSTGRLYWSETIPDVRWPMRSWSVIRSSDSISSRLLTKKTRYYHPAPAPDEAVLAVTEYPLDGTSRVLLLDAEDGSVLRTWDAPAGMQVLETAWACGELYASAITEDGAGLFHVEDFQTVLNPNPVSITQLWGDADRLLFTCDRSGVSELYSLDPQDGRLLQLTDTRFGASDFVILRDTLFYTTLQPEGRLVRKTALADLRPSKAEWSARPHYPFAEELAAGEQQPLDLSADVEVSTPQPYGKLVHLFRFHSWLPFYFHYDSVDNLSLATLEQDAGLGVTAFWQNDLGTSYGFAGYHAAYSEGNWRHSFHANFTYTGLYPVLEGSLDLGGRQARSYYVEEKDDKKTLKSSPLDAPSVSGRLRAYVPWNFSSGGWLRGLVPTATLIFSNDCLSGGGTMNRTTFSLRGYAMQRTPASRLYPRYGIGGEVGASFRWTPGLIAPSGYISLYGYLPGLHETHGLRWSGLVSHRLGDGLFSEAYAITAPRGFPSAVTNQLAAYATQMKGTLDYKMPILPVDRALLGPVAYLRNFELTLHGDGTLFRSRSGDGSLWSAGADLVAVLGNLLWIPYVTRVGVAYNYLGGSAFADFAERGPVTGHHDFSLVFSIEM